MLAAIPNLPLEPKCRTARTRHGNVEHHHFGAKRNYPFQPKQHFELGEALGYMDFETAAKLSGARFVVLKSGLARMERALGQFFVDVHTNEHGYTEVAPPLLVRDEVMYGTAQLPKFEEDQFSTHDRSRCRLSSARSTSVDGVQSVEYASTGARTDRRRLNLSAKVAGEVSHVI